MADKPGAGKPASCIASIHAEPDRCPFHARADVRGGGRPGRYFFLGLACVSADPATLFTAGVDFGLLSSFDALLATLGEVCSFGAFFVAIVVLPGCPDAPGAQQSIDQHCPNTSRQPF